MKIIATYMNDMGRQRITKYVSKKFEKSSNMSKQFNKEMHKIKQLTKMIANESKKNLKNKANLQVEKDHEDDQNDQNNKFHSDVRVNQIEKSVVNKDEDKNEDEKPNIHCIRKAIELKNLFYTVNRILHKYHLLKCRSKYKCTSTQSLLVKTKEKVNAEEQKVKPSGSSISMQQIANDAKATSLYNSIKMNLTAQKPYRSGKGVSEVLGFKEVLRNNEKNKTSNVTYRFVLYKFI